MDSNLIKKVQDTNFKISLTRPNFTSIGNTMPVLTIMRNTLFVWMSYKVGKLTPHGHLYLKRDLIFLNRKGIHFNFVLFNVKSFTLCLYICIIRMDTLSL